MAGRRPAACLVIRRRDLAGPVLDRVLAAFAARVELPLDRLSDVQIASAAAAAAAGRELADEALRVELDGEPGALIVRLGPLPAGVADRVVEGSAVPGVGSILDRLVDRLTVDRGDGGESLSLAITGAAPRD